MSGSNNPREAPISGAVAAATLRPVVPDSRLPPARPGSHPPQNKMKTIPTRAGGTIFAEPLKCLRRDGCRLHSSTAKGAPDGKDEALVLTATKISGEMASLARHSQPTFSDRIFRIFFRIAFAILKPTWFFTRPHQYGALVLIWHKDRVLLVRNSYQPLWSLPGGTIDRHEEADAAAVRELNEELGIKLKKDDLYLCYEITIPFNFRKDNVKLFEWRPMVEPDITIDQKEIVDAGWFTVEEASEMSLIPHLNHYFEISRIATNPARDMSSGAK